MSTSRPINQLVDDLHLELGFIKGASDVLCMLDTTSDLEGLHKYSVSGLMNQVYESAKKADKLTEEIDRVNRLRKEGEQ